MEIPVDNGSNGIDKGIIVCHFQGIRSTKMKAVVDIVLTKTKKCGKDFDTTMSSLCLIVAKKNNNMHFVHITEARIPSAKLNVAPFMKKKECTKYHKVV